VIVASDRTAARVGAVALVLLVAGIVFAIGIVPGMKHRDARRIRVSFLHAGGLREGAPLVVAGREVGVVEAISTTHGGIVATVAIAEEHAASISRGGDVFVASRGLLGDKYLELGAAPAADQPYREGELVVGRDPPQMDRVMNRTWENLQNAKAFAQQIKPAWQAFRTQLVTLRINLDLAIPTELGDGKLGEHIDALVAEFEQLHDVSLGGDAGIARIGALIDRARGLVAEAKVSLAMLQAEARALMASVAGLRGRIDTKGVATLAAIDRAIAQARAAIDKIDPLLANIKVVQDRIARGEGSLLRMMRDPEFPEDAKELGKILKRQPWKIISRPTK